MTRILMALLLFVCLLCGGGPRAEAFADLPTLLGVDWRQIFQGRFDPDGNPIGFYAPGASGYPRDCRAKAGTCMEGECCSGRCDAHSEGLPQADQPWQTSVYLRQNCQRPWIRKDEPWTMFPTGWPDSRIRATVLSAYNAGRHVDDIGNLWCGCAGETTIFGRQDEGLITDAWPSAGQPCGCENVPLKSR